MRAIWHHNQHERLADAAVPRPAGIPVLFSSPRRRLSSQAIRLEREIGQLRTRAALARSAAARTPARTHTHEEIARGLECNAELLDRVRSELLPWLGVRELPSDEDEVSRLHGL